MVEQLKAKRNEYAIKLNNILNENIAAIVEAKFNEVKEQIKADVIAEHEQAVKVAKDKVNIIDEMIAEEEAKENVEQNVEG